MKQKSRKSSSDTKHTQVHQDEENPSCFLKPGMAKLHPSIQRGTAGTPTTLTFSGTYVLWLRDVVVRVVTAQRGLAGHRQLGRWRWVVSKGHQVVVLLKASSCWGVAGFGGLLQVALLLNLSAHGGVPVVLDSIISSATEIQGVSKMSIYNSDRSTGRELLLAILFKPWALFSPSSFSHHYKCYSQLLRKNTQYKS